MNLRAGCPAYKDTSRERWTHNLAYCKPAPHWAVLVWRRLNKVPDRVVHSAKSALERMKRDNIEEGEKCAMSGPIKIGMGDPDDLDGIIALAREGSRDVVKLMLKIDSSTQTMSSSFGNCCGPQEMSTSTSDLLCLDVFVRPNRAPPIKLRTLPPAQPRPLYMYKHFKPPLKPVYKPRFEEKRSLNGDFYSYPGNIVQSGNHSDHSFDNSHGSHRYHSYYSNRINSNHTKIPAAPTPAEREIEKR